MPGTVLYAGATDWKKIGRNPVKEEEGQKYPNLTSPHRISVLGGAGQLGLGNRQNTNAPTVVEALSAHVVIGAAGGKMHTLVFTDKGEAFSFGSNKHGQLGTGSLRVKGSDSECAVLPVKAAVTETTAVAAGADFSCWLCGGALLTAGSPQYGQLGHGNDHEYNMKEGSVKLAYTPQPTPKKVEGLLADVAVTKMAAGQNHTVCIDANGKVYTWGNGGYGRLGHKEQKDEFSPRQVIVHGGDRNACPPDAKCAAGANSTWITAAQGQVYYWGKIKTSGDNQMYPKAFMDLSGWNIRSFSCGAATFSVTGDKSTITWGGAQYGELAYGPGGKKSSASPDKVHSMEGLTCLMAACGVGQTLFLVDEADPVDKFPVWEPPENEPEAAAAAEDEEGDDKGVKRKGGAGGSGSGAKKGGAKKK